MSSIGKSLSRIDVKDKVTGQALFPGDINKYNQVHMKILFAARPHAIIRKIETSKADDMTLSCFLSI